MAYWIKYLWKWKKKTLMIHIVRETGFILKIRVINCCMMRSSPIKQDIQIPRNVGPWPWKFPFGCSNEAPVRGESQQQIWVFSGLRESDRYRTRQVVIILESTFAFELNSSNAGRRTEFAPGKSLSIFRNLLRIRILKIFYKWYQSKHKKNLGPDPPMYPLRAST